MMFCPLKFTDSRATRHEQCEKNCAWLLVSGVNRVCAIPAMATKGANNVSVNPSFIGDTAVDGSGNPEWIGMSAVIEAKE